MMIWKSRLIAVVFVGFFVSLLTSCAPPGSGLQSYAQVAAQPPGTARVWFVRTSDPQEQFGDPIIFANGQQLGRALPGVAFYHDFPGRHLLLHRAKLRSPHQHERYDSAGARDGNLSGDPVGRQLAGWDSRRSDLFCKDAAVGFGAGVCSYVGRQGSAPGVVASIGERSCPSVPTDEQLRRIRSMHEFYDY